jgi:diguanylate cyclase (GGDEF)-like protein
VTTELILFVNGASPRSARAIRDVRALCALEGLGPIRLEFEDVQRDRARVSRYGVLASPTLVRTAPLPVRMVVGDLSDTGRVLSALGMTPGEGGTDRPATPAGPTRDEAEIDLVDARRGWAEAEGRLLEVHETLRAVGAGEVDTLLTGDGFVVPVEFGRAELDVDGDRLNQTQIDQLQALQQAQAALTLKATHDSLTGLPNRTLLVDRLEQALLRALRTGHFTAVFFIDLDRFKHINDTRGHAAGDEVLTDVADRLRNATRPMDTVARIGGDEFVVLTPDLTDQMEAAHIADRLAAGLGSQTFGAGDSVTASIGISVSGAGQATAESMLKEADAAMYHAKSLGRNRAELYDAELSRRVIKRAATEEYLRQAIDEHRVVPYYQPIVDLRTGHVAGYEALARIIRTGANILSPDEFISVAEECGLVVPLGAQMLAAACRDAQRWGAEALVPSAPTVSVNLSPRQLQGTKLAAQISVVLAESALAPTFLHLEITESALMELRPEVVRQLNRVRDLGVEIGLDDFGTGYASLTHLRRLPVTFVKVDRSFISRLGEDVQDEQIVAAVIELAANLGLRSIAEGLETPQQLDRLRELGCDHAQGYLFARPAPTTEAQTRYSVHGSDY